MLNKHSLICFYENEINQLDHWRLNKNDFWQIVQVGKNEGFASLSVGCITNKPEIVFSWKIACPWLLLTPPCKADYFGRKSEHTRTQNFNNYAGERVGGGGGARILECPRAALCRFVPLTSETCHSFCDSVVRNSRLCGSYRSEGLNPLLLTTTLLVLWLFLICELLMTVVVLLLLLCCLWLSNCLANRFTWLLLLLPDIFIVCIGSRCWGL